MAGETEREREREKKGGESLLHTKKSVFYD